MLVAHLFLLILLFSLVSCWKSQKVPEVKRRIPNTPVKLPPNSNIVEGAEVANRAFERNFGKPLKGNLPAVECQA